MKPLGDYFKPEPTPEQRRDAGAARVAAMFDRMVAKQEREGSDDDGPR